MKKTQGFWKRNRQILLLLAVLLAAMFLVEDSLLKDETFTCFSPAYGAKEERLSLRGQESFSQKMIPEHDRIEEVYLNVDTAGNENSSVLELRILDWDQNCLLTKETEIAPGLNGQEIGISLETDFENIKGRKLTFELKNVSEDPDSTIRLATAAGKGGILRNSDQNCLVRILYYDFDEDTVRALVKAVSALCLLGLAAVVAIAGRRKWKTENLFLILYGVIGLLYFMIIPISGVPDEMAHMSRVYGITEGDLIASVDEKGRSGSMLPSNLLYDWKGSNMKLVDAAENADALLTDERVFTAYSNTALYSPFTYVPQCIGVAAGRILSDRIYGIAYIGRFLSWLIVGAILYWSIRILPFGKNTAALIVMLPMSMQENISLAGDSFTTAVVIAFVSYVLYLCYGKGLLKKRDYALLFLLLFFVASCKIVYVPICLLAFLIPVSRFPGRRNYLGTVAAAASMVLVLTLGWLMISSRSLMEFREGVNTAEQVRYILCHPGEFLGVLVKTVLEWGDSWVENLFGTSLGWLTIECKVMIIAICAVVLVYVAVKEQVSWKTGIRFCPNLMLVSCGIIFLLICTSLYVQWTAVGKDVIEGIQGRYFLPILLPFILGLKRNDVQQEAGKVQKGEASCIGAYLVWIMAHMLVATTLLGAFLV